MHSCTPRFSLRCSLSFQPMLHPACSCPPLAPCWTARLGRLGASLLCSRWRISKHCHNPCSCCFSDINQLKYVNYDFFNCSSSNYHDWFQLSYTAYVAFVGTLKKVQIHMIICYKALLLGHCLEIHTALVLCDGCHFLFYLTHKSHRVSVQGNEVSSGVHQSLKVDRTTVLAFAGIGYFPLSELPLVFGLRSASTLTWNV